jgi:hypothetical protein
LGCDLTADNELVLENSISKINSLIGPEDKREFVLLIY